VDECKPLPHHAEHAEEAEGAAGLRGSRGGSEEGQGGGQRGVRGGSEECQRGFRGGSEGGQRGVRGGSERGQRGVRRGSEGSQTCSRHEPVAANTVAADPTASISSNTFHRPRQYRPCGCAASALLYRRKLNLKPEVNSSSSQSSFKRVVPGAFNVGFKGSTCTD